MSDGPLPIGDAAAAILIIAGLCIAGLAALASSGAIALPMRQTYDFAIAIPTARVIPNVTPFPSPTLNSEEFVGFHGTSMSLYPSLLSGSFQDSLSGLASGRISSELQ